jgi:iron complex transport system substrate-binding protein
MRACVLSTILVTLLSLGCNGGDRQLMAPSPRVVTFSPALTKIVFDLGLGNHVVGVTSFCSLPEGETRQVVGNAMAVRAEPILDVEPDLVLVQMEVKHFEPLLRLRPNVRIEHFEIETLEDVASAIARIGSLLGDDQLGKRQSRAFREHLQRIRARVESLPKRRVLFVSGYTEPLAAGKGTFLDEMIAVAGGRNVLGERLTGWHRPSLESIVESTPEVLLCLCDPDQKEEVVAYWSELDIPGNAETSIYPLTDPTWTMPAAHLAEYTSRLVHLIHPEISAE